jgi:hypothetical protein
MSLDRLPFDILFSISTYLEIYDVVHIGSTCRQLRLLLLEQTVCRWIVEVGQELAALIELADKCLLEMGLICLRGRTGKKRYCRLPPGSHEALPTEDGSISWNSCGCVCARISV